jgi:hypothetical protein
MTNTNIDYGFSSDEVQLNPTIPNGEYVVTITNEEKADNGVSLIVDYKVIDTQYKGMTFRQYYNIFHTSTTPKNIARADIKKIAEATGKVVDATNKLSGRTFKVILEQGGEYNGRMTYNIKKYLPEFGVVATPSTTTAAPTVAAKTGDAPF